MKVLPMRGPVAGSTSSTCDASTGGAKSLPFVAAALVLAGVAALVVVKVRRRRAAQSDQTGYTEMSEF